MLSAWPSHAQPMPSLCIYQHGTNARSGHVWLYCSPSPASRHNSAVCFVMLLSMVALAVAQVESRPAGTRRAASFIWTTGRYESVSHLRSSTMVQHELGMNHSKLLLLLQLWEIQKLMIMQTSHAPVMLETCQRVQEAKATCHRAVL